jgi:hypothetical protein
MIQLLLKFGLNFRLMLRVSIITLFLGLFFITTSSHAQDRVLQSSVFTGLSLPILDAGSGLFFGFNPSYHLNQRIALEGQLSYSYMNISSAFISGARGNDQSINLLVGGRLYLSNAEKTNRFYVNLLMGYNYFSRFRQGGADWNESNLGYSTGLYMERNKWVFGLALESYTYTALKIGRIF